MYLFLPQNVLKNTIPQVWHEGLPSINGLILDWEDDRAYCSYIIIFEIYLMTTA